VKAQSYRDLTVWQLAMDLVVSTCALASQLPRHELFGLGSQLRRASVSVPANIAEGYSRVHRGDYVHHLSIARGSLEEVSTEISHRLGYLTEQDGTPISATVDRTGRMLRRLIDSLRPGRGHRSDTRHPIPDTRS
jgi:four helix bundle protein